MRLENIRNDYELRAQNYPTRDSVAAPVSSAANLFVHIMCEMRWNSARGKWTSQVHKYSSNKKSRVSSCAINKFPLNTKYTHTILLIRTIIVEKYSFIMFHKVNINLHDLWLSFFCLFCSMSSSVVMLHFFLLVQNEFTSSSQAQSSDSSPLLRLWRTPKSRRRRKKHKNSLVRVFHRSECCCPTERMNFLHNSVSCRGGEHAAKTFFSNSTSHDMATKKKKLQTARNAIRKNYLQKWRISASNMIFIKR